MSAASPSQTQASSLAAVPKAVWIVVGTLAIATAGLGGALVARSIDKPAEPVAAVQPAQAVASVQPQQLQPVAQPEPAAQPALQVHQQSQAAKPKVKAATQHAAAHPQPAPAPVQPQVVQQPQVVAQAPIPVTPVETRPAATCNTCGVVAAVTEVKEKAAQGSGIGAVGGAIAGGVLGHQVGGGNGKKLMTVLGAVGGGLAGNEAEKYVRATVAYDVQVRMEDGSVRTLRRAEPVAVGTPVQVEGNSMRVSSGRQSSEPRALRTSAQGNGV